jgi:Sulfotransferase domain
MSALGGGGEPVEKKPNFFIVGAPKCGTTALYEYLRPHPNIFMSPIKEPHFFARDLGTYPRIKTMEEYRGLFAGATPEHLRVGEASVYYLRSTVALANIREFNPDAKIIAMFRNPVEMVHALHSQLLYVAEENVPDFETAWRLQERRSRGLDLPPRSRGAFLLQYAEFGRFGTQVERLLSAFPRSQAKLILYDDFRASPQRVYDEVIAFLDLPHDNRTEFPRINENKRVRLAWLRDFYQKPPPALRRAVRRIKHVVGGEALTAVSRKIVNLNTTKQERLPLSPELRAELVETFRDEIQLLGRLLNRDLSHWLELEDRPIESGQSQ